MRFQHSQPINPTYFAVKALQTHTYSTQVEIEQMLKYAILMCLSEEKWQDETTIQEKSSEH